MTDLCNIDAMEGAGRCPRSTHIKKLAITSCENG